VTKDSQINIRFDAATDAELEGAAKRLGVSKSSLIRRLTRQFLDDVRSRGAMSLGAEWVKGLAAADARTKWGERKIDPAILNDEPMENPPPSKGAVSYGGKGGKK
jgi:hypothetical protein